MRDARLSEAKCLRQAADALLALGEEPDHPQAHRVGERLQAEQKRLILPEESGDSRGYLRSSHCHLLDSPLCLPLVPAPNAIGGARRSIDSYLWA